MVELINNEGKAWLSFADGSVKGFAFEGERLLEKESLYGALTEAINRDSLADLLVRLNGNFAAVITIKNQCYLIVDKLRSYPLFYSGTHVSDVGEHLLKTIPSEIDEVNAYELLSLGYLSGASTLVNGIKSVVAGSYVVINTEDGSFSSYDYFSHIYKKVGRTKEEIFKLSQERLEAGFQRMLGSLKKNQPLLIPLSGGYDFREDLFVPGYFEFPIKKGESVIFSASVDAVSTGRLKTKFQKLLDNRAPRNSFVSCLKYSASQFIVRRGKETEIMAGYPWFGRWGRDTFIALPGVTLAAANDGRTCKEVLDTMIRQLNNGLFPNIGKDKNASYNSVDAPMWFFKAVQEYGEAVQDDAAVWKSYGAKMKAVLKAYRDGINEYVKMVDNGLIWADEPGKALTWMDAIVNGVPVTPRGGYQVEINALWYNAICYTLKLAGQAGDNKFVKEWKDMPDKVKESFLKVFWNEEKGYLADFVNGGGQNVFVRPNQVIACSLEYSPLSDEMKHGVLDVVKNELLTPKGLRTLAPKNPAYEGTYEGDQATRDRAYHQGTVWPWLLGPYIEANFRLYGKKFAKTARELLANFEEDMTVYGVCSIGEIYDGNPPYTPNGCISQAWSVGEILRSMALLEKFCKDDR